MNSDVDLTENGDFADRPEISVSRNMKLLPWRKPDLSSYIISYDNSPWFTVSSNNFTVSATADSWRWELHPDGSSTTTAFIVVDSEIDLAADLENLPSLYYNSQDDNFIVSSNNRNALDKRRYLHSNRNRRRNFYDSIIQRCCVCNCIVYDAKDESRILCSDCERKRKLYNETRNFKKQIEALEFHDHHRYDTVKLIDRYGHGRWDNSIGRYTPNEWCIPLTGYKAKAVRYKGQKYYGRGYAWQPKGRVAQAYDEIFERLDWRELLGKEV